MKIIEKHVEGSFDVERKQKKNLQSLIKNYQKKNRYYNISHAQFCQWILKEEKI